MASAAIAITDAFPICTVKVFRESEDQGDWFCVTRAEKDTLCLEAALDALQYPPPQPDEQLCIQSATADAAYRLTIRVAEISIAGWVTVTGKRDGEIERIQRRARHRLLTSIPVRITGANLPDNQPMSLMTEDINSIGMRILTRAEMPVAASLNITIDLGDRLPELACRGGVVRCRRVNEEFFEAGVRFQGLDKAGEDRIVQTLLQRLFHV